MKSLSDKKVESKAESEIESDFFVESGWMYENFSDRCKGTAWT